MDFEQLAKIENEKRGARGGIRRCKRLLAARINEMRDEDYAQYFRYPFYICEKPELLGMTNHLLFVGEKK